ncbi:MAG: hypothetical protein PHU43_06565 [Candidatus Bipolaricaulis sp.]|nr:hypothetical protein [Candidatus Bipolaricaulis sp.]
MAAREDRITVYLDKQARADKLLPRLEKIAERERRAVSFIVCDAVRAYLAKVEGKKRP